MRTNNADVIRLFQNALSGPGTMATGNWEELMRMHVRERFAMIGNVGAGVFLRLLRSPGDFVSQTELARAAGVRSGSLRVIKVYICALRKGLASYGLPPRLIETGRRSYRLNAEAVPAVVELLT